MFTYEGGAPITGTCNITADAVDRRQGVSLLFIGGSRRDAKPYEHFSLNFSTSSGVFTDFAGFNYEAGDQVDVGTEFGVSFSHSSELWSGTGLLSDEEAISASCSVRSTSEDLLVEGDITLDIDGAVPVCRVANSEFLAYEVHGNFTATCVGDFGAQLDPNSRSQKPVTIEVTF